MDGRSGSDASQTYQVMTAMGIIWVSTPILPPAHHGAVVLRQIPGLTEGFQPFNVGAGSVAWDNVTTGLKILGAKAPEVGVATASAVVPQSPPIEIYFAGPRAAL
jgi:hypothetical protein